MARERQGHMLEASALVNEAWLRLLKADQPDWRSRTHFFSIASQIMRRILVDYAREVGCEKRGAGAEHVRLEEILIFSPGRSAALVALDEALDELATFDARKSKVVELRYFGGMSVEEAAEALMVHPNTVIRGWSLAKIWLKREVMRRAASSAT
jgi:RNA polymerase sigma-70 factor (ECF subfamily)